MSKSPGFKYIDLFAGCGGLSLGLERSGGILKLAVERSPMASETFYHNLISRISSSEEWEAFLKLPVSDQGSRGLVVKELEHVLSNVELTENLSKEDIDLVVGGPPCQGFSLAGKRNPKDSRNQLPWQFLEMVEKTNPKIVVIENVVGMRHKFSADETESVFTQLQKALAESGPYGYVVQATQANALHYGAPQHRPRLLIVGLRGDLAKKVNNPSTGELWMSDFEDKVDLVPLLSPQPIVSSTNVPDIQDALTGLLSSSNITPSSRGVKYLQEMTKAAKWGIPSGDGTIKNHVVRKHQEQAISRFRLYQIMAAHKIDEKILNKIYKLSPVAARTFLDGVAAPIEYPIGSPDGKLVIHNKKEFVELMVRLKTGKHSQRVLKLKQPARTVLTVGDDYVHPLEPRTFTVRELARFQGFPDDYEFRAKETTGGLNRRNEVPQYSQVGNAVSPWLAIAIGQMVQKVLEATK